MRTARLKSAKNKNELRTFLDWEVQEQKIINDNLCFSEKFTFGLKPSSFGCSIVVCNFALLRSSRAQMFFKTGVLKDFVKFTGKKQCQSLFFNKVAGLRPATFLKTDSGKSVRPANLLKKRLAQVFSCEFSEDVKNTFFDRTPPVAASDYLRVVLKYSISPIYPFERIQKN